MSSSAGAQPPSKRQRIPQACNACRQKKSRCNGGRPACSSCVELRIPCEYLNDSNPPGASLSHEQADRIMQRVADLEQRLASTEALRIQDQQSLQLLQATQRPHASDRSTGGLRRPEDSPIVTSSPHNTTTDGLAHFVHSGAASADYFGPSSNIALMRDVSDAAAHVLRASRRPIPVQRRTEQPVSLATHGNSATSDRRNTSSQSVTLDANHANAGTFLAISRPVSPRPASFNAFTPPQNVDAYALPTERRAEQLLHRYFENTGTLFPYLFPDEFMDTYFAWRQRRRAVESSWVALLNMVLALAVHTTWSADSQDSTDWEMRHQESALFYHRALYLCPPESLEHTTIEAVQCLTLMVQYQQGTPSSIKTWTVHGLAVKCAMQLGLHSDSMSTSQNVRDRERRKRVWYGCVILDRMLATTFGRPCIIPSEYVKISLPEYVPASSSDATVLHSSAEDRTSHTANLSISFFRHTIQLYQITAKALSELFDNNVGLTQALHTTADMTETCSRMLSFEREMDGWKEGLQPQLRLISSSEEIIIPDCPKKLQEGRFRFILTLRFHNLNVLIHRPLLSKSLTALQENKATGILPTSPVASAVFLATLKSGLRSASLVIDLVHFVTSASDDRRLMLGAWWFTLYYTFNSAIVVFANTLLSSCVPSLSESSSSLRSTLQERQTSVRKAAEAIEQLYASNRRGIKCSMYLRRLESTINFLISESTSFAVNDTEYNLLPASSENTTTLFTAPTLPQSPHQSTDTAFAQDPAPGMLWPGGQSHHHGFDDWNLSDFDFLRDLDPLFDTEQMRGLI